MPNYLPEGFEMMNGMFAILCAALFVVFSRYAYISYHDRGYKYARAAIALTALFFGETLIRSYVWIWRHMENAHHSSTLLYGSLGFMWMSLGVVVSVVGSACIVRMFSPDNWPKWSWSLLIAMSVAVSFCVALLH